MKYLTGRGVADTTGRKVWAFMGDGEMDEPESMGAIGLAARERLDNLIFVVNCNLQRLDGPVRGNGKIIQELEAEFRGAGWNVIKVIWGGRWDPLLAADTRRAARAPHGGGRRRRVPDLQVARRRLRAREVLRRLPGARRARGRTCPTRRSGCSTAAATTRARSTPRTRLRSTHTGEPTVILAKTIKGYGMGEAGEGQNITHQQKKMTGDALLAFRDAVRPRPDRRGGPGAGVPQAARRLAGDDLPARAPRGARRAAAGADADGSAAPDPSAGHVQVAARGHRASARSRRRWRSCGSSRR